MTIEELLAERANLQAQITEFDAEHQGERLSPEQRDSWRDMNHRLDELDETIDELQARAERVRELADNPQNREEEARTFRTGNVRTASDRGDIYDLSSLRRDFADPQLEAHELRDRAMRAIEQTRFSQSRSSTSKELSHTATEIREHIEAMLDKDPDGRFARYVLTTGSPAYKRAFPKVLAPGGSAMLSREEQAAVYAAKHAERALSLTGSAGGFAVPFELDPTIIPTSNLAVNPYRAIARVENITVDEWRGVSSAGVTAAYAAEATPASDNAPTLAQPTISTEKAQAFIPYSIEVGMDWPSLQAEMGRLLRDAKDELEAVKFTLGTGTNEPQGVITGATTIVTASGTASFALADLDSLEAALGARFRPNASMVLNRAIAQRIRRFDTAGGAGVWIENTRLGVSPNEVPSPGRYAAAINGYPAYESSAMDAVLTTGSEIAILGDFRYYLIADRIGLTIETIPHLFDTTNNRPTGQRGLYAYWRNGAGVLSPNAFRVLRTG